MRFRTRAVSRLAIQLPAAFILSSFLTTAEVHATTIADLRDGGVSFESADGSLVFGDFVVNRLEDVIPKGLIDSQIVPIDSGFSIEGEFYPGLYSDLVDLTFTVSAATGYLLTGTSISFVGEIGGWCGQDVGETSHGGYFSVTSDTGISISAGGIVSIPQLYTGAVELAPAGNLTTNLRIEAACFNSNCLPYDDGFGRITEFSQQFSVEAIPEPSGILLFGIGFAIVCRCSGRPS